MKKLMVVFVLLLVSIMVFSVCAVASSQTFTKAGVRGMMQHTRLNIMPRSTSNTLVSLKHTYNERYSSVTWWVDDMSNGKGQITAGFVTALGTTKNVNYKYAPASGLKVRGTLCNTNWAYHGSTCSGTINYDGHQ